MCHFALAPLSETGPCSLWLQVHSVLQDAGLLRGLVGALVRQRDTRAFTAAARALFPVPNQPQVPDTTVPWPAPRNEGALPPRPCRTPPVLCVPPAHTQSSIVGSKAHPRAHAVALTLDSVSFLCTAALLTYGGCASPG